MASPLEDRVSSAWMALQASMVFSASPSTRSSPSRFTTATENSCSSRRMFSSNEPKMLTACSSRSILILCSNVFSLLYHFGRQPSDSSVKMGTLSPICSSHSARSVTSRVSPFCLVEQSVDFTVP